MHGDEANQAVKTGILLEEGEYVYDPHDHHGPTLYYFALIPAWISGADSLADLTEPMLRVVPVLFGVALVLLLWFLRDGLGNAAAVWAAAFVAVSPAFVFYSRYFIQEILLVFFTTAAIAAGWRYIVRPHWSKAIAFGACIGLMHATKETAVLAWAAMAGGAATAFYWDRDRRPSLQGRSSRDLLRDSALSLGTAVTVSMVLFSSFLSNARGPLDSILTYGNYLTRASGAGYHDKPWWYYLRLLAFEHRGPGSCWSEGFVLALALVGFLYALTPSRRAVHGAQRIEASFLDLTDQSQRMVLFRRFLALFTLYLTLVYSVIPYKTPWALLTFYFGWVLLAGVGATTIIRLPRALGGRVIVASVLAFGTTNLALQAYRASFVLPADPINPYVYAHTASAHMRLVDRLQGLAAIHPDGYNMRIDVIQPDRDYWPLPWYLRQFSAVGYWDDVPDAIDAVVVIAEPRIRTQVEAALPGNYLLETGVLRPNELRAVYIDRPLWDDYMRQR